MRCACDPPRLIHSLGGPRLTIPLEIASLHLVRVIPRSRRTHLSPRSPLVLCRLDQDMVEVLKLTR